MTAVRTMDEVAEKCAASDDMFGFEQSALLEFLDFEHAKPLIEPETTAEQWTYSPLTRDGVLGAMRDYMEFAWGKVEDHRGISAGRSVTKFRAWCWVLGDEEAEAICDDDDLYPQYGAPVLRALCERFGFPLPSGEWYERMSTGLPCGAECCGCGR